MSPADGVIFPDGPLVCAVGAVHHFEVERAEQEEKVDHVWVTLDAGLPVRLVASLNTLSWRNRVAGFDPRVRIAVIEERWTPPPHPGLRAAHFLDYETLETLHRPRFEILERTAVEEFFRRRCLGGNWVEVWGMPYRRHQPGLHQIHSRRASCAVHQDLRGRDGAVRFHHLREQRTELVLVKFCGQ